uniref:Protein kinase D3 n=1 Tax=Dromaius novaehollandiae TaxID=8790 RepID=A0A8C4JHN7_DRONO
MSANDSSPPSLQKFSPPTCHAAAPQTPTLSSSPQSGLSSRLSNGSFSTQSLTNSRGSMHGVSFLLQIGLTRETVTIEAQDLSLSAVKDLVCSIVYQKMLLLVQLGQVFAEGYVKVASAELKLRGSRHAPARRGR